MKALTYHGPHHVSVDTMPDPALEAADDIILRVTATAICGSDLHLYRGKIPGTHHGDIFGHEFMGGSGGSRFRGHRGPQRRSGGYPVCHRLRRLLLLSLAAVCRLRKHQ